MTHGHRRDIRAAIGLGLIHLIACAALLPGCFSWSAVTVFLALHVAGSLGIAFGYHRFLAHGSVALRKPVAYLVVFIGSLAFQGGPIDWIATHRAHHAHTDRQGDPHNANRGLLWAHVTWIFRTNTARIEAAAVRRWVPDLAADPFYRVLEAWHLPLQTALGIVLFVTGGLPCVVWGIFLRLVVTYHCTWLVNSAAHAVGYRNFATDDRSRNNWFVSLMTFGEGWHNNHHAFPYSAKHGLRWFELDLTYGIICVLRWARLADAVLVPPREARERYAVRR